MTGTLLSETVYNMRCWTCYATAARPGTIIEGGGYRQENESDSLKYKDIRLHLVKDPRNPTRRRLLMLIRLRLMKGYRNRGSP